MDDVLIANVIQLGFRQHLPNAASPIRHALQMQRKVSQLNRESGGSFPSMADSVSRRICFDSAGWKHYVITTCTYFPTLATTRSRSLQIDSSVGPISLHLTHTFGNVPRRLSADDRLTVSRLGLVTCSRRLGPVCHRPDRLDI